MNVTIHRDDHSLSSSEQLTNLDAGEYMVSLIGELECDCTLTILRTISLSITLRITGTIHVTSAL